MTDSAFTMTRRWHVRPEDVADVKARLAPLPLRSIDHKRNTLILRYQVTEVHWPDIVVKLHQAQPGSIHHWRNQWRDRWYRYVDSNALSNALSNDAHCCNRPPPGAGRR
ncbi:hypothetical protein [Reinekea blandensis]|uniref:Uncharacterized protein n=1 Tax=Reinekea blandensis MED297 TaxID=314283 RepID=A4BDK0_9GAMM|nr:hypothetical protein [Reinekea blandensis]EAR09944.1 hypothetical protein MED297_06329 [Reinekea sp. MED297] [Reinekea blandensis MED297]